MGLKSILNPGKVKERKENLVHNQQCTVQDPSEDGALEFSFVLRKRYGNEPVTLTITSEGIHLSDPNGVRNEADFPLNSLGLWTRRYRLVTQRPCPYSVSLKTSWEEIKLRGTTMQAQEICEAVKAVKRTTLKPQAVEIN
eukprot:TRINITY_DN5756_c0_g1_i1.p1 TRINITY_DN5756_c0_g1~~TRINITY_DN5756_c0_g1_i1.p1  ORF type:complete len:152 (-),score=23.39 TRINITY_DN5756_c0_g1_i1:85-504(-)